MQTVRLDPKSFERMVWAKAWRTWRALPMHTRTWIDVDDLAQAGRAHLYCVIAPRFEPQHGTPPAAWVAILLDRFFIRERARLITERRCEKLTVSADALPMPTREKVHGTTETDQLTMLTAREALMKIYALCSKDTQREIRRWFGPEGAANGTRGMRNAIARCEFRELAQKQGFGEREFRLMLNHVHEPRAMKATA
ncbi:MAG: hypothetical protein KGL39_49405 [Patescibacteria group bacterium]|nr:hypothetical protein [Patescibacteria group bacterium]